MVAATYKGVTIIVKRKGDTSMNLSLFHYVAGKSRICLGCLKNVSLRKFRCTEPSSHKFLEICGDCLGNEATIIRLRRVARLSSSPPAIVDALRFARVRRVRSSKERMQKCRAKECSPTRLYFLKCDSKIKYLWPRMMQGRRPPTRMLVDSNKLFAFVEAQLSCMKSRPVVWTFQLLCKSNNVERLFHWSNFLVVPKGGERLHLFDGITSWCSDNCYSVVLPDSITGKLTNLQGQMINVLLACKIWTNQMKKNVD